LLSVVDKTGNRQTSDRRLQDSLFLLVKRNRADGKFEWQVPQGKWNGTESLREV